MESVHNMNEVEVLLVEDNPSDAELTIRALKKKNLANKLVHVKDGAEAIDFVFSQGAYLKSRASFGLGLSAWKNDIGKRNMREQHAEIRTSEFQSTAGLRSKGKVARMATLSRVSSSA